MQTKETKMAVVRLDRIQLKALLLRLEDVYRQTTGEKLSSEDFYARYLAGEFDEPWGMAWATYYEAFIRKNNPQ